MRIFHWPKYIFAVAALCGFLGVSDAIAQTPALPEKPQEAEEPKTSYTGEIDVIEKQEPALTSPSVEKAEKKLGAVPGGTNLIDAETYERGRASSLKDALDFTPGVLVQPRFGSEESRLSIRGSGLQRTFHGRGLRLLQDGVPLNLADGAFDFQAVEPLAARYIEVFRGANALEYGSSTLGGAINYVSRNGWDSRPLQARAESGSFGYLRGQVSSGFSQGKLDGFATLTHSSGDGYRRHSAQSNQRFLGNLGFRPSDGLESRFYLAAFRSDSELPGNLTKAQLEADPRLAAPGNVALDQKRDFDLLRLSNRTSLLLGEGSRIDFGGFWSYKNLDHPIFQVLDQESNDLGADVRYENESSLLGRPNHLVIGFSPVVGFVDDDRFVNVSGRRGARTAAGKTTSVNMDLYAENRHQVRRRLSLSTGLQVSRARRDFADDFLPNGDQTDRQDFDGISPKLGLIFELTPAASVFANVSRSFEPPTFGELVSVGGDGLLRLRAQTASTLELGSRGKAGAVSWDLALYHARVSDELLGLNDAVGNPLGTINAGRTLHSGAEVGLEARFGPSVLLRQVYDWSRFRFDGDPVFHDNVLAGVPEHFLRTELLFERGGFYGGPNVESAPKKYPVDHANTLFADPYTILGLKLGYRTASGLSGFVEGRNLTDETYAATTGVIPDARGRDSAQFLPGDGASVYAGLEYRW
ncbi:MAG TPA: TonB-dependent receptor [Thermoanaerobaculia bacterium]|nr:TonB-dependent receptor [Thermoanaerobaculia bacterium]